MRHFAEHLRDNNYQVNYVHYTDEGNQGDLLAQVKHTLSRQHFDEVKVTVPGEYRLLKSMQQWQNQLGIPVTICEDNRFFSTPNEFSEWSMEKAASHGVLYREMRRKHNVLMDGKNPIGGNGTMTRKIASLCLKPKRCQNTPHSLLTILLQMLSN